MSKWRNIMKRYIHFGVCPKFMDVTYEYAYSFEKELVIPLEKLYRESM